MYTALTRAFRQLLAPETRRPVLFSIFWAALLFILLWIGAALAIHHLFTGSKWVEMVVQVLGALAAPVLAWLLFPSVAIVVLGFYADRIVGAVEHRYYPDLTLPPEGRFLANLWSGIRLAIISLLLNLAALPFYIWVPGLNLILFLALNGYVTGREYFDAVALRRLDLGASRRLWARHRLSFVFSGMVAACLFAIPVANLVAPVVGLAAAVHLVERYRTSARA